MQTVYKVCGQAPRTQVVRTASILVPSLRSASRPRRQAAAPLLAPAGAIWQWVCRTDRSRTLLPWCCARHFTQILPGAVTKSTANPGSKRHEFMASGQLHESPCCCARRSPRQANRRKTVARQVDIAVARPAEALSRLCQPCTLNATGQYPGHAIAAGIALKSSLWATAGGNGSMNPAPTRRFAQGKGTSAEQKAQIVDECLETGQRCDSRLQPPFERRYGRWLCDASPRRGWDCPHEALQS